MKKRCLTLLCAICALLLALPAAAQAEYTYYGTMMVDNCEEWVSLRDGPGTGCARLKQVPLYAIVTDAGWDPFCGDFIRCSYNGQQGYILSRYLVPWSDDEPGEENALDVTLQGYRVTARRSYDGIERLSVTCTDAAGGTRWTYDTETDGITELTMTEAFIGGAWQDPMVMVYNSEKGLAALDVVNGELRWMLSGESLGASVSWAVDGEGNIYIGGYYGPDPVCIDVYGRVKWRADSQGAYWLYGVELEGSRLVCDYEVMEEVSGTSGHIIYNVTNGSLIYRWYD